MSERIQKYLIENYDFELPAEQIAQHPAQKREDSRLLLLEKSSGLCRDCMFSDLADLLPPDALLVRNVSRVFPARLPGRKLDTGGRAEFLLTTPLALINGAGQHACAEQQPAGQQKKHQCRVQGLLKPASRVRPGQSIRFGPGLEFCLEQKKSGGQVTGFLSWQGSLQDKLQAYGQLPLPPYIQREVRGSDLERYQTIYAREDKAGSVAAPTAGLHFDAETMHRLQNKGLQWADINLYVGYGTFSPVRTADVRSHAMHAEYIEIEPEQAQTIEQARQASQPIVAVGTTVVRALESVMRARGKIEPYAAWSDLYIYPGYRFQIVQHLITNFHLPRSSLLLLVSAFAGRENILASYQQAVALGYRFFSYGDCMLIL